MTACTDRPRPPAHADPAEGPRSAAALSRGGGRDASYADPAVTARVAAAAARLPGSHPRHLARLPWLSGLAQEHQWSAAELCVQIWRLCVPWTALEAYGAAAWGLWPAAVRRLPPANLLVLLDGAGCGASAPSAAARDGGTVPLVDQAGSVTLAYPPR